jgi:hypothetical protein
MPFLSVNDPWRSTPMLAAAAGLLTGAGAGP